MARKNYVVAICMLVIASPIAAANRDLPSSGPAPIESAGASYCMHIEALTGSLIETVRCWTRAEWAEQGVDVDREWAKEGLTVIR